MAKMKGLLARLARAIVNLGNITTDKGIISWDGEEDLKAGDSVFVEDSEGNRSAAADGDYKTEDGKTIKVVDGKVAEISDPKAEVSEEENEKMVQTDKGKLEWDNEEEDLKAGDAVYITDEDGNRKPAPDGDYTTEDGKVISVKDGKVERITDTEAEVDAAKKKGECKKKEACRRIAQLFSQSYNEKFRKIEEAIAAFGYENFWLCDAGDDFAVVHQWDEETYESKYIRFKVSWDGDDATVSDPVEVVMAFVTPEERDRADEAFSSMKADYEKVKAELAKLKKTPAGKNAHEEFRNANGEVCTGNKGLDRLAKIMNA